MGWDSEILSHWNNNLSKKDLMKRSKNWRNTAINNTIVKYINIANKIYEVTKLSFFYMMIEAVETKLTATDIPEDELWDISEFRNYHIKLINNGGHAEIIDFVKWMNEEDRSKR